MVMQTERYVERKGRQREAGEKKKESLRGGRG